MAGNLLIGQSGGPTAVINGSLLGAVVRARESNQVQKVFGMRYGIEGFLEGRLVDFDRVSRQQLELLRETPSSALGSCRYKLTDADLPRVLERLREHDIRYYLMIGGNDTMDTINRVEAYCRSEGYELSGVGIPKTVDNDLYGTDHTPGYPSAARYVALSAQQSGRLARDMQRVDRFVVHQTVGRDAGWLAASATLARRSSIDPPHLVLVPERPISSHDLLTRVRETIDENGWVYLVVGEGALWSDGTPISASKRVDGFQNLEFGAMGGASAALNLHRLIGAETGFRGEFQITESLSMCASDRTSDVDRREAYACGVRAAELAVSGTSGQMVTILRAGESPYRADFGTIPLSEVAERTKPMPDEFLTNEPGGVTDAFLAYLRPLVGPIQSFADLTTH